LGLFPHFRQICQGLVNLMSFLNEPAFVLLIICVFFSFFHSLFY
jgi:hypothetical protein